MDCAQCCSSLCNGVTLSEERSAGHCTYPVAGGKRPIDYKPFPTATTSAKASVLRFVDFILLCSVPIALVALASVFISYCYLVILHYIVHFTDPLIGVTISYESRYP